MSWFYIIIAGLLEACWAAGLKETAGFTKLVPSLLVGSAMAGSMVFLALGVRTLPIGVAYAVWVSIGILGTVLAQAIFYRDPMSMGQWFFASLLLISVVGLKLSTRSAP